MSQGPYLISAVIKFCNTYSVEDQILWALMHIESWKKSLRKRILNCKSLQGVYADKGPRCFLHAKATFAIISKIHSEEYLEIMRHG